MFTHIAVVRDLVDMQYKEYQEVWIACSANYLMLILWPVKVVPVPFLSMRLVKYWTLFGEMLECLHTVVIFKGFLGTIK